MTHVSHSTITGFHVVATYVAISVSLSECPVVLYHHFDGITCGTINIVLYSGIYYIVVFTY